MNVSTLVRRCGLPIDPDAAVACLLNSGLVVCHSEDDATITLPILKSFVQRVCGDGRDDVVDAVKTVCEVGLEVARSIVQACTAPHRSLSEMQRVPATDAILESICFFDSLR